MTFRSATPDDAEAIERFLQGYAETSMFLRSNLRRFGPCGGDNAIATRMWVQGDPIQGVIGISTAGYVLLQMPHGVTADVRDALAGQNVKGITGAAQQVTDVAQALGVAQRDEMEAHDVEPLYRLELADLICPEGPGQLRTLTEDDIETFAPWRRAYRDEVDGAGGDLEDARKDIGRWIEDRRLRVLEDQGQPLCLTGLNATLPDMVQIGGVYTPPDLRGRGHARRAVALDMVACRDAGVRTAILFAAGPAACRAYEAIGFRHIGSYQLLMFPEARRVPK